MKDLFVVRNIEYIDPMNIETMSALARRERHSTFLSIMSQDDLEADLKRIRPDVVAFSTLTGEHTHYLRAAALVKKIHPEAFTVIGGPHCTFFPEIIEDPNIDAVGMGECDDAWPELLRNVEASRNIHAIHNIITKENWFGTFKHADEAVRRAHLRGRTTFLDGLPFLDRELVYRKTHLRDFPMRSFMSSRGCPFECTYCFEPKFNQIYRGKGPIFNRFSVRRMCEELKELKERWPTQFIKFYDDMFFVSKKIDPWLEEFAEVYPQEVGLPFFCLTRCNVLTEEILLLLKRAGLHSLTMSIEAGDDYIRDQVIKRHMTREEIHKAFDLCHKHGIVTFANSILGIPVRPDIMAQQGKTPLDYDIESLDLNLRCRVTFGEFGTAYPYPGCELTEYVQANGWFDPTTDFDKLHMSYQSESPLNCFTPKEKLAQKNLEMLGTVCIAFPWLRNLTVKHLIHLPLGRIYFVLYYLTKGYLNIFKVYPMSFTLGNLVKNIWRSFRNEYKKHAPGSQLYAKPVIRDSADNQMLGGPPRI